MAHELDWTKARIAHEADETKSHNALCEFASEKGYDYGDWEDPAELDADGLPTNGKPKSDDDLMDEVVRDAEKELS